MTLRRLVLLVLMSSPPTASSPGPGKVAHLRSGHDRVATVRAAGAPQTTTLAKSYSLAEVDTQAVCLSGTPATVAAHTNASSTDWILQIGQSSPGLNWCVSEAACKLFAAPPTAPHAPPAPQPLAAAGIQSQNCTMNPRWCHANQAVLTVCDFAMLLGNASVVLNDTTLHFRGLRIIEASLQKLASLGLQKATRVVLTGFSQSGTMVVLHADRIGARLRQISPALQAYGAIAADPAHPLHESLWVCPLRSPLLLHSPFLRACHASASRALCASWHLRLACTSVRECCCADCCARILYRV